MDDKARVKEAARRISQGQDDDKIITLSTGVRVRLHTVSSTLTEDLRLAIPMPKVPVVWIEAKEREEENPNDPDYIEKCKEVDIGRGRAVIDALITFGVELVDDLPEDQVWLRKLKRLHVNLAGFDLDDPFDLEFLYKRYVAVAGADLPLIYRLNGLQPPEVAHARSMFLGKARGGADRGVPDQELGTDGDRDKPNPD